MDKKNADYAVITGVQVGRLSRRQLQLVQRLHDAAASIFAAGRGACGMEVVGPRSSQRGALACIAQDVAAPCTPPTRTLSLRPSC